jgi:hypothetical protein
MWHEKIEESWRDGLKNREEMGESHASFVWSYGVCSTHGKKKKKKKKKKEEGKEGRKEGRSCSGILMMLLNVAWSTRMVSPYQTRSEIPLLQQFRFGNFLFVLSTWMEMVCCTTAAAAPNLTAKALSSPSFFPKASPFLLR